MIEEEKGIVRNSIDFKLMTANGHGITIGDKIAIGFDTYDEDCYERIMWFTVVNLFIGWYEEKKEYRPVYTIRDDNSNEFYRLYVRFNVPLNDRGTKDVEVFYDKGDDPLITFGKGTIVGVNCGDGSFMHFDSDGDWIITDGLDISLFPMTVTFRFDGLKESAKDKDGHLVLVFDPDEIWPEGFDQYMRVNTIYSNVYYNHNMGFVVDERPLLSARSIDESCIVRTENNNIEEK